MLELEIARNGHHFRKANFEFSDFSASKILVNYFNFFILNKLILLSNHHSIYLYRDMM